nr:MAG TPA: hypothetical protein [Caudoviricetes sp.]
MLGLRHRGFIYPHNDVVHVTLLVVDKCGQSTLV